MRDYLHFLMDYHPLALRVWFFGLGACVGSFLNVCILRIPAGKSIVTPRSQCSCGKPIAWYDNIPIFSWFILRGRARCCGAKFSVRYSIIEAVTACVFLWLWMNLPTVPAVGGMVFFSLLLLGSMIDVDHMLLPDISTIGGMFIGVILSCLFPQIQHIPLTGDIWIVAAVRAGVTALIGIMVGTGVVFWVRELGEFFLHKEAMGYGDVLLMGCIGAFCGWQGAIFSLFGGGTIGFCVMVPLMLSAAIMRKPAPAGSVPAAPAKAALAETPAKADGANPAEKPEDTQVFGVQIPFGPWLALGGFLYYAWPWLHSGVNAYFEYIRALIFDNPLFPGR